MPDHDALDERLRAVERTLTDGDHDLTHVRDAAARTREIESLEERLDEVERRLDELDAATQALRGYVGNVRAVNDEVERRADAALAKVEELEAELERDDAISSDGGEPTATVRGEPARSEEDRPCGCASRSSRTLESGIETEPKTETEAEAETEAESETEIGDEESGVLARLAAALAGLAAPLTGAR